MTDDERLAAIRSLLSPETDAPWLDGPTCRFLLDQLDAANAALDRVRALHKPASMTSVVGEAWCGDCERVWPCPTIRALDGDTAEEGNDG